MLLSIQCDKTRCIFKESGWAKNNVIDKKKVSDYFEQFAKDNPDWSAAVQNFKTTCLSDSLKPQGVDTNCPAYDIIHCALISFIKVSSVVCKRDLLAGHARIITELREMGKNQYLVDFL